MKKLYIKTFGCQMNEYDSGKMADLLHANEGMEMTNNDARFVSPLKAAAAAGCEGSDPYCAAKVLQPFRETRTASESGPRDVRTIAQPIACLIRILVERSCHGGSDCICNVRRHLFSACVLHVQ